MKWLKKLLGLETTPPTTAPADAGAKAFDAMAKTLSAPEEKVTVAPVVTPEVQAVATKVDEAIKEVYGSKPIPLAEVSKDINIDKPKAPRKPRAKKDPVAKAETNPAGWPFPGDQPAEGEKKAKPAAIKAKTKKSK